MKIVITEFMDERAVDQLRAKHEVDYDPALVDDPARLAARATSADALIVRNRTQVRDQLLAALARCKVVGRLGVGLDNIDVAGCEARGLRVIPATGANALSVAEYVVTSAMLLLRGAYASTAAVAQGRWPRAALSSGREVAGKTLGLIGFGSIGQLTARLARGVGMEVTAFDAMMDMDHPAFAQHAVRCAGLEEVITMSDVVSLHVPLVESTRGLFDAQRIASMKKGAVLINTARGGIVVEQDLADALRAGAIAGAAVDTLSREPPPSDHVLLHADIPHLIVTPHNAWASRTARQAALDQLAQVISGFAAGRVLNQVG